MKQLRRGFVKSALAVGASASLGLSKPFQSSTSSSRVTSDTPSGHKVRGKTPEHQPPLYFLEDDFVERRNMAWRVEPGQLAQNNPLMTGQYPWDGATPFYNGTVLIDPIDGLWKLWGISCPEFDNHKWGEWDFRVSYA